MGEVAVQLLSGVVLCLVVVVITVLVATVSFNRMVKREIHQLFGALETGNSVIGGEAKITREELAQLPACVQRWLEKAQVVGRERIRTAHLEQKIQMRTAPEQDWMPAVAEQYVTVKKPGFVWHTTVKFKSLLVLRGRDKYLDGYGQMLIKIFSLIPVARAKGPEVDQGTLLRFMGEMAWFPTAALSNYITWEPVDDNSARATMTYEGISASGVFYFDENGDLLKFSAKRYRQVKDGYQLDDWGSVVTGYGEFNGIRIPSRLEVIWKLKEGDFTWFKCEITGIEYNVNS